MEAKRDNFEASDSGAAFLFVEATANRDEYDFGGGCRS
jgi:hypothetical protein